MSRIKRWMDDVYYKKILEGKTQELIDEGISSISFLCSC